MIKFLPNYLIILEMCVCAAKYYRKSITMYRNISRQIEKLFERTVFDQLYDYFTTNGLVLNSQYDFRKHHSTELAVLELTDKISREIDQKRLHSLFI